MYLIRQSDRDDIPQIGETLRAVAKSLRMPANSSAHEIFDRWQDFVGEYVASQSRPLQIVDQNLIVAAANPLIAKELTLNGPSIINIINVFLNAQVVDKLEVKTGPTYARRFRRSG